MHVLICIGIWICTVTILARTEILPANHLLIMDQSSRAPVNSRDFLLSINGSNQHHLLPKEVFHTICSLGISSVKPTRRGKKGGRKYRQKLVSSSISNVTTTSDFSLFSLNCQSVKSKVTRGIITDLIAEHDIDIFALTETWLAGNESDDYILSALTPPGYDIYNVPRGSGDAHGGIIVLFKKGITVVSKSNNRNCHLKSFESCDIIFTCGSKFFTLVTVYRPPPSRKNKLNVGLFFEEFSPFLQDCAISKGELVLVGDLNFHLDIKDDPDAITFLDLIDSCGLTQSVVGPTHRSAIVACTLQIGKPKLSRKQITSRKYRSIDPLALQEDIASSTLITSPATNINDAVKQYNDTLSNLLDQHAPLSTKTVVPRVQQPWFSDSLYQLKRERRKAERKWKSTGLTVDFDHFKEVRNNYNVALFSAKCSFYNSKIIECGNDFKTMFSIIGDILQKKKSSKLPDHDSPVDLANQFAHYFMSKIETIRTNMSSSATESDFPSLQYSRDKLSWQTFTNVSEADVREIIAKSTCPSSLLDPLPSWLVKQQLDVLLPTITAIVNKSSQVK